jgi:hypothetical protein
MKDWIGGGYYKDTARAVANERCINLIPEIVPDAPTAHSRGRIVFHPTPGFRARYGPGSGNDPLNPVQNQIRGLFASNGRCFTIAGAKLAELLSAVDPTAPSSGYYNQIHARGIMANDGKPACIASNRFQLAIASSQNTYIYDLATNTLVNVAVPLAQVRFADGYFVGLTPDSQIIRISGQYDGLTWDPLDFASAEGDPDNVVAIITDHREIWTLGRETVEVWADSGDPDFPLARIPGALIEQGCAAANSVLKADNSIFWLGSDSRGNGIFWRANGYTPQRISTHAIEELLATFADLSDAIGYAYQEDGHIFCVWTFPTADKTLVYDCATTLWHERAYWNKATGLWERHRAQCHCFAFGMHLVGDRYYGTVYEQSGGFTSDDGNPKRWLRSVPLGSNENKYLFPRDLEIDIEAGAGFIQPESPGGPT